MTQNQKNTLKNALYNFKNTDSKWDEVVRNTLVKFAFEREEQIIKMFFFERKARYNICRELQIKKRQFYYCINRIYDMLYLWAVELKAF